MEQQTVKRNKSYGVLIPDMGLESQPKRKPNGKIEDFYDVFSFPTVNFIVYQCKGIESGSGFRLIDVDRRELQAKQIRESVHVEDKYDYMDKLQEMGITDPRNGRSKSPHTEHWEPQITVQRELEYVTTAIFSEETGEEWNIPQDITDPGNEKCIEAAENKARDHTEKTGQTTRLVVEYVVEFTKIDKDTQDED